MKTNETGEKPKNVPTQSCFVSRFDVVCFVCSISLGDLVAARSKEKNLAFACMSACNAIRLFLLQ